MILHSNLSFRSPKFYLPCLGLISFHSIWQKYVFDLLIHLNEKPSEIVSVCGSLFISHIFNFHLSLLSEERYKLTSLSEPEVFCIIKLTDKKLFSLLTFTYEVEEDDVILATMLTSTIVRVWVWMWV